LLSYPHQTHNKINVIMLISYPNFIKLHIISCIYHIMFIKRALRVFNHQLMRTSHINRFTCRYHMRCYIKRKLFREFPRNVFFLISSEGKQKKNRVVCRADLPLSHILCKPVQEFISDSNKQLLEH
jgi:hypothetical protein